MTDREKVIRLGNYIINLRHRIVVYEAVFSEYRIATPHGPRGLPFRDDARHIGQEEALTQIESEQRDELLRVIGQHSEPSILIQELCRLFLERAGET